MIFSMKSLTPWNAYTSVLKCCSSWYFAGYWYCKNLLCLLVDIIWRCLRCCLLQVFWASQIPRGPAPGTSFVSCKALLLSDGFIKGARSGSEAYDLHCNHSWASKHGSCCGSLPSTTTWCCKWQQVWINFPCYSWKAWLKLQPWCLRILLDTFSCCWCHPLHAWVANFTSWL